MVFLALDAEASTVVVKRGPIRSGWLRRSVIAMESNRQLKQEMPNLEHSGLESCPEFNLIVGLARVTNDV